MTAVLKKEIKSYYTSLMIYIYYSMFFLTCGILFSVYCLQYYNTQFGFYVLSKAFYVSVFMIPVLTMRMFARERHLKTDQMLFTSPVPCYWIVLGKYIAGVIVSMLPVLISVLYPVYISTCGDISVKFVFAAYLAVVLCIFALVAIGMFLSTLTENVILAALFMYGFYLIMLLSRFAEGLAGQGGLYYFIHNISIYNIYNDMTSGIVRTGNTAFIIIIAIMFIFLTWIRLIFKRIGKKRGGAAGILITLAFSAIAAFMFMNNSHTLDYTPEQLLTLSQDTKDIIRGIDGQTTIYYMGDISGANATYQEFLSLYERENDHINVEYVDYYNNEVIRMNYLSKISEIHDASMLVVGKDSYVYLDSDDYVSTIQSSQYDYQSLLEIEGQLTNAIYYSNSSDKEWIYMLSGHEEIVFDNRIENKLSQMGYKFETLSIKDNLNSIEGVVPSKCNLLVMYSPQTDYSEDEVDALSDYIDDGGKLVVLLDALNEDLPNLYGFLKKYGLSVESGVIIEKDTGMYNYETSYYLIPELKSHEITDSLIDHNMRVCTMTSKGILIDEAVEGTDRKDLLVTSRKAFAKLSDYENLDSKGENDIGGPFSIASIVEKGTGKLFLVTSDLFLDTQTDEDMLGANSRFFINAVNYMTGKTEMFSIIGKDVNYNTALYRNNSVKTVRMLVIFVIPILILVLGIVIILIRKNNILINYRMRRRMKQEGVNVGRDDEL